ncbi:hypothetical protein K438DRAFT_1893196 [Mycena galopus ATCC 62051]|nr:hypothetical protein K438DRAFT_1893196 [Mycena galopus ATCC 62051]
MHLCLHRPPSPSPVPLLMCACHSIVLLSPLLLLIFHPEPVHPVHPVHPIQPLHCHHICVQHLRKVVVKLTLGRWRHKCKASVSLVPLCVILCLLQCEQTRCAHLIHRCLRELSHPC